jgi:hypothetical protein
MRAILLVERNDNIFRNVLGILLDQVRGRDRSTSAARLRALFADTLTASVTSATL